MSSTTTATRLTPGMAQVLDLAIRGESLYSGSRGAVPWLIDKLIAAGYLEWQPMGYVRVTDAGRAAYAELG